ncbi:MAG: TIGR02679 family protein [Acidimicrobiales bacterium]
METALLDRPSYRPLWVAARRRLEANGLSLQGTALTLKNLSAAEADAIAGMLGVRRPTHGTLRVPLGSLDRALRSSAVGCGLVEVLTTLGGPLVDRREARARRDARRTWQWGRLERHPAVRSDPALAAWLDHVRTSGLARRLAGDDEAAAVSRALDVLSAIGQSRGRFRLPVLAADVTGDAHGLDRGKAVGTLATHALAWLADQPFPRDASTWRRTWAEAGVACDDLSCDVLVLNLPGYPAEPLRLTLRQASSWRVPVIGPGPTVFVTENPAVVAAAADDLGDRAPTMVCLDGMPSTAALVVLDGLAAHGCTLHYHGDFDWRGLAIAGVLARKVESVQPWRFGATAYHDAIARGLGTIALSGRTTASPWHADLAPAMEAAGVAVYEEQVLDDLLADLLADLAAAD